MSEKYFGGEELVQWIKSLGHTSLKTLTQLWSPRQDAGSGWTPLSGTLAYIHTLCVPPCLSHKERKHFPGKMFSFFIFACACVWWVCMYIYVQVCVCTYVQLQVEAWSWHAMCLPLLLPILFAEIGWTRSSGIAPESGGYGRATIPTKNCMGAG